MDASDDAGRDGSHRDDADVDAAQLADAAHSRDAAGDATSLRDAASDGAGAAMDAAGQPDAAHPHDAAIDATDGHDARTDAQATDAQATDAADANIGDDGIDNDCDGYVDEATPELGEPCSDGAGVCQAHGHLICAASGTGQQCSAVAGDMTTERCDGIDNDCNGLIDDNQPAFCLDTDLLQHCAGSTQVRSCAASHQTCVFGACSGSCVARTFECLARDSSRECSLAGNWRAPVTCTPTERCDDDPMSATSGRCIDNPVLVLGKASTGGDVVALADDSIYAQAVFVPWDATIQELGVRTSSTSHLGQVEIGVYTDDAGEPDELVRRSMPINLVQGSSNPISPLMLEPASRLLDGPAIYWVVVYVNAGGAAPEMLVDSEGTTPTYRSGVFGGGGIPTAMIPTGTTTPQPGRAGIWMSVRRH